MSSSSPTQHNARAPTNSQVGAPRSHSTRENTVTTTTPPKQSHGSLVPSTVGPPGDTVKMPRQSFGQRNCPGAKDKGDSQVK